MAMTFREVKEMFDEQYVDIEVYAPLGIGEHYPNHFHTDNCVAVDVDEIDDDTEVGLWSLMDEEEYADSILANADGMADFEEWYGDKNTCILCVMLKR